jgi:glycolate oxidase iron-sulfur subunit
VKPLKGALPEKWQAMLNLLPETLPKAAPLPVFTPAVGSRRARVALLAGCVQQALAPELNWATLRVLAHNGVEVVIPEDQGCCGALANHTGEEQLASRLASHLMGSIPADVDVIVTNAAGCGSGMKEYPALFQGTAWSEQAERFSGKVMLWGSCRLGRCLMRCKPPITMPVIWRTLKKWSMLPGSCWARFPI